MTNLTDAQVQAKAKQVALKMKAECLRQGKREEARIADYLMRAVAALPAYELAIVAVADVGEDGLPAAVIRRLALHGG